MTQPANAARRRFIRTTTGGVVLASMSIAGCDSVSAIPESAVAAWQPANKSQDPRHLALSYAILAPNPHNRQPWLVDLSRENEIGIRIDTERLLPETDPFGRQILIGTGAMIELLDIAAAHLGYRANITLFEAQAFGDTIDQREVARVRFQKSTATADPGLFEHIVRRRTVRDAYDPARSPDPAFEQQLSSEGNQTTMGVIHRSDTPDKAAAIAAQAKEAWKIELITPHTSLESVKLLRIGARQIDQFRDGISLTGPMMVILDKLGMISRNEPPAPDSSAVTGMIEEFNTNIDSTPAFFWLVTQDNTRATQIQAGRDYVRAHLLATANNMFMHPLSQGLQEYKEVKGPYEQIRRLLTSNSGQTVQMLCRLGYLPDAVSYPGPSPRRGLNAHLTGKQI